MHPQIKQLEALFSQRKIDPAAFGAFFDRLWITADLLPRNEMREIVDHAIECCSADVPLNKANLAIATFASGFVAFHEGDYHNSLSILALARELFSELNDEQGVYAVAFMEGCNYRTLGEMELAVRHLLEAHQHLQRSGCYRHFLGFCLHQLAEIYSETGQLDEALKFHQLCEKYTSAEETENKTILARTLNGIGVVYRLQKKYALALEYLGRALKLTEQINNPSARARVLTDLGIYYFEMGDYQKAAEQQQQALDIRVDMHIENGVVTNMILLAEISVKSAQSDEAIVLLNKALSIAEQIMVKQKMFHIHSMLSEIYQLKGDTARSLFHYKTFHLIREEVQNENNEKKIKNLHLIFQAEQTIQENAIIKAQKIEIETRNTQLQETIDELTITKISRKAKALTLIVGITLVVAQDPIFELVLTRISESNYLFTLAAKVVIIMSLKPIDIAIEKYLLKKIVLKKKMQFA